MYTNIQFNDINFDVNFELNIKTLRKYSAVYFYFSISSDKFSRRTNK
jgi:hypothetical protein